MKPIYIEPKTYFANDRVFIQWLMSSVFVMSLCAGLISIGSDTTKKFALASMPVSLLILLCGTRSYYVRLSKIKSGDKKNYGDAIAPGILALLISVAIAASVAACLNQELTTCSWGTCPDDIVESDLSHRLEVKFPPFFKPQALSLDPSGRYLWSGSGNVIIRINLTSEKIDFTTVVNHHVPLEIEGLAFSANPKLLFIGSRRPNNVMLVYDTHQVSLRRTLGMDHLFQNGTIQSMAFNEHLDFNLSRSTHTDDTASTRGTFWATNGTVLEGFKLGTKRRRNNVTLESLWSTRIPNRISAITSHGTRLFGFLEGTKKMQSWDPVSGNTRKHVLPGKGRWTGLAFLEQSRDRRGSNLNSSSNSREGIGLKRSVFASRSNPPEIWRLVMDEGKDK